MQRYIHFIGLSAVGKKTLIRTLIDEDGSSEAFGPAFQPIEQIYRSRADTILHQWQYSNNHVVTDLLREFPEDQHECYHLWMPFEDNLERIKKYRPWIKTSLQKLREDFFTQECLIKNWEKLGMVSHTLNMKELK